MPSSYSASALGSDFSLLDQGSEGIDSEEHPETQARNRRGTKANESFMGFTPCRVFPDHTCEAGVESSFYGQKSTQLRETAAISPLLEPK
jgi:hypothetical protein